MSDIVSKKFVMHYKNGRKWDAVDMYLDDITEDQFTKVSIVLSECNLQVAGGDDKQNGIGGLLGMNMEFSRKEVYPKVLAEVLVDENGDARDSVFYMRCKHDDVLEAGDFFFANGVSSLLTGISNIVVSNMLKKLQENALRP